MRQEIRFCTTPDGVRLAWSTMGSGPPLVKAANWLSHLEFDQESPVWRHWLRELSRDHTFIRYDERGCGLSDWDVEDFSLEAWVADLEAVVDAAGLDRFALLGISQGGPVAIAYAARHPERVSHLVLYGTYARGWAKRNSPSEAVAEQEALITLIRVGWGRDSPAYRQVFTHLFVPEANEEQTRWFNELCRISTSPENAVRFRRAFSQLDVAHLLDRVPVPPLVLHGRGDQRVSFEEGRALAAGIAGSRFVSLPSRNHLLLESEPAWPIFLAEVRRYLGVPERPGDGSGSSLRRRAEALFETALERSPGERGAFLAAAGVETAVRLEAEALLRAHQRTAGVLERSPRVAAAPAPDPAPSPPGAAPARRPRGVRTALEALVSRLARLARPGGAARARGAGGEVGGDGESPAPLGPGSRISRYEILGQIGAGGMGVVYSARDEELGRTVALKLLPAHLGEDEEARRRFLVEARAAAALDHPHICTVHEIGTAPDGRLYLVMPRYEGATLRERIDRGVLAWPEAADVALQVARGLMKAHSAGIVHRDVKPSNVLLTSDGIAKLMDFGIAKRTGGEMTRTGAVIGSVPYMCPEQARGERVDERADVWSLGVVLYEMLAGERPFRGAEPVAVLHTILTTDPEPLETRRPDLPPRLAALVRRCLLRDAAERCPSAAAVAAELECVLAER